MVLLYYRGTGRSLVQMPVRGRGSATLPTRRVTGKKVSINMMMYISIGFRNELLSKGVFRPCFNIDSCTIYHVGHLTHTSKNMLYTKCGTKLN